MKQYKVIALSVGGRANKIFSAGDTVNEDHFIPGRAEELVKQGFLQRAGEIDGDVRVIDEDVLVEIVDTKSEEDTTKEPTSLIDALKNSLSDTDDVKPTIDSKSRKELIKELTDLGVPFDPTASKKELFDLWMSKENY